MPAELSQIEPPAPAAVPHHPARVPLPGLHLSDAPGAARLEAGRQNRAAMAPPGAPAGARQAGREARDEARPVDSPGPSGALSAPLKTALTPRAAALPAGYPPRQGGQHPPARCARGCVFVLRRRQRAPAHEKGTDVPIAVRPPLGRPRQADAARRADGERRRRGDARGAPGAARGRRGARRRQGLHREGQGQGGRPGRRALGHARADGRQDRQRRARRHAGLRRGADRSQCGARRSRSCWSGCRARARRRPRPRSPSA